MKVIRKANLNLLITQRALRDVEVLTIINGHGAASGLKAMNSPQLTELRHNPNKSFGEKMARRIEAAFGLPRGFLDEPQTPEAANAAFAASKPAQGDAFFRPTPSAAGERLLQLFETLPERCIERRAHWPGRSVTMPLRVRSNTGLGRTRKCLRDVSRCAIL